MGCLIVKGKNYLFLLELAFALVADFTFPFPEILFLSALTSVVVDVSAFAPKIAEFSFAFSLASSDACAAACDLARASPFSFVFVLVVFSLVVSAVAFAFFSVFAFAFNAFLSVLSIAGLASTSTSVFVDVEASALTPNTAEFSL